MLNYISWLSATPIESTQHLHLYNNIVPQGWEKTHLYRNENLSPSPLTTYSANRLTAIGLVWIIGFDCYWDRLYILEVPAEVVFSPVKQSRYWYILSGRVAGPGINVWFVYQSTLHAWTLQPEQWLPDVSMPQSSKEADCIGNKNACLSVNC